MARKEISTPLDLKNLDNHNYNYEELYSLIDETDRRISEDMWEEIKDANTMKMLEPVQTAADLPSEAADKSLITVIDEQRVYGFVNGEWQPFSEIDLDPFEPFKTELSEIVAAYEKKIQNITQEVQSTKDSAIDSIESTQSQSESNIQQTEQSAVNSINQTQSEAESQISDSTAALKGKTEELTKLFNDSMDKLTSKQDTALAEVDSAKQAAITELENFQNTDTSSWQKYKLTTDDGGRIPKKDTDVLSLTTGFYECWNISGVPREESSKWFIDVYQASDKDVKLIKATLGYTGEVYQRTVYGSSDSGWKELAPDTSGWQKHKLTTDDGGAETISSLDFNDTEQLDNLSMGVHYLTTAENIPDSASSRNGFLVVYIRGNGEVKRIEFKPYDSNQTFVKIFYNTWGDWL